LVRERDQNGDHHLQEIPSPGKRYEDRGISLTALFDHCEGLFEDAKTSETIITALIADRATRSWNRLILTVTISLSVTLNLCYTYWYILAFFVA